MPFKKNGKGKRSYRPKKRATRKVTTATGVTNSVAKFVKRTINNIVETKVVTKIGTKSLFAYTGTSWSSNNCLCLTPMNNAGLGTVLSVGDGQENRTGNMVKTYKVMFKGVIYNMPYNVTTNPFPQPQEVVFWFISFRPQPNISINPVDGTFFQEGNSSVSPQGTLIDIIRSINKERFYVYGKKIYKIGYQYYDGAGSDSTRGRGSNNDFKLNQKFSIDVTDMCPKKILFNDATLNDPTTRSLWVVWEAVNADGSTQSAATIPLNMQYQIDYEFKDA